MSAQLEHNRSEVMGVDPHSALEHACGPGLPLVFTHIPKTAGTALTEGLISCLQPRSVYGGLDNFAFGSFRDFDAIPPRVRAQIAVSPSDLPADAEFVTGHITPSTTMARYPGAKHLTVLREPRVRVLSLWLFNAAHSDFMLRHWGVLKEWLRAARKPLPEYLSQPQLAPHMDNHITRFLVWPHPALPEADFIDPGDDDELCAAALERLDRYSFVGCVENPELASDLGRWLGRELVMTRPPDLPPMHRTRRPDVNAELAAARDMLDARCRIDARVWRHVVRRTMPAVDPAALADRVLAESLRSYARSLAEAPRRGYLRTTVETAYDFAGRVRTAAGSRRSFH
jgi:hypothetical protein